MPARICALRLDKDIEIPESWRDWLPADKLGRLERYRNRRAAILELAAEALLRLALRETFGITEKKLVFAHIGNGKPVLTAYPDVHFNLSHSGDTAVCAVGTSPVGADVELIKPVRAALAKRIMSCAEYAAFLQSGSSEEYFFSIWTLKESYLKYLAGGIGSQPLSSLSFNLLPDGRAAIGSNDARFRVYRDLPGRIAALCSPEDIGQSRLTIIHTDRLLSI